MAVASPAEGQFSRVFGDFVIDANLEFLKTAAALPAITTDGEDHAAPDLFSDWIDLGLASAFFGAVFVRDLAINLTTSDERALISVVGADDAKTAANHTVLAAFSAGDTTVTGAGTDWVTRDVIIPFSNVQGCALGPAVVHPQVRLEFVTYGTTAVVSVASAHIVRWGGPNR